MMDEARIREIVREEMAAGRGGTLSQAEVEALYGETFDRNGVAALIEQINDTIRDGAQLQIRPE